MKHLHEYIIITLTFLSVCYSKEFALFATSPLGKLAAILLIVGYATVNEIYGLIVCAIIILYYQTDYVENIQYNYFYDWREELSHFAGVDNFSLEGFEYSNVSNQLDSMLAGFQQNMSSLVGFDYVGGESVDEINKNSKTIKPELHAIFSKFHEKSIEFINGTLI